MVCHFCCFVNVCACLCVRLRSCVLFVVYRVTLYVFCVLLFVSVCTCVVLNVFVCFVCALLCEAACFLVAVVFV